MERRQEALELVRKIRKALERCSDELTWDVSGINEVYARIDEVAQQAHALEQKIAAL